MNFKPKADLSQINAELNKLVKEYVRLFKVEGQVAQASMQLTKDMGYQINKITTVNKEGARLTRTFKALTNSMQVEAIAIKQGNTQHNKLKNTIKKQVQQVKKLKSEMMSLHGAMTKTDKKAKGLDLSWRSMWRLVGVQLAHQAVSQIARAFVDGARKAIDFQKRIGEIQTISQEAQLTQESWAEGLRKLSDSWGLDILDQAEAAYQTLSNQVAKGIKTFEFMEEANRFAVTTNSSVIDSVNLLTAALNSYHLEVEDTNQVAALMFKTIELGRVRANELSESYGDVAVMSRQLGVSMEALSALYTTLSIQGLKVNKVQTQLRGIFVKLLKPSKSMKKLFDEMGVSSGEVAIQTYGLYGFLKKLKEVTKGSSTEIAKYINRIRGLSGIMGVINEKGFKIFIEDLEKLKNATDSYGKATAYIMQSAGKALEIEITKIKNFFLKDIGNTVLNILAKISNNFKLLSGGIIEITNIIMILAVPAIVALTVALGKLAIVLWSVTLSHPILAALAAITAAAIAAYRAINAVLVAQKNVAEEVYKKWEFYHKKEVAAKRKTQKEFINNISKSINLAIAQERLLLNSELKSYEYFTEKHLIMIQDLDKAIDKIQRKAISNIKNNLSILKSQFNDFANRIKVINKSVKDLAIKGEKQVFEWEMKDVKGTEKKIESLTKRIKQLQEIGTKALVAGDLESFNKRYSEILELYSRKRTLSRKEDFAGLKKQQNDLAKLEKYTYEEKLKQFGDTFRWEQEVASKKYHLNKAVEAHNEKQKGYQEKYLQLINNEIDLKEKLKKQDQEKLEILKKQILTQKMLEADLLTTFEQFKKFNIVDVLKLDDRDLLDKAFDAQRDAIKELMKLQKEAGIDYKSQKVLQQKLEKLGQIEQLKYQKIILENEKKLLTVREEGVQKKLADLQQAHNTESKLYKELIQITKKLESKMQPDVEGIMGGYVSGKAISGPTKMITGEYARDYGVITDFHKALKDFTASPEDAKAQEELTFQVKNMKLNLIDYASQGKKTTDEVKYLQEAIKRLNIILNEELTNITIKELKENLNIYNEQMEKLETNVVTQLGHQKTMIKQIENLATKAFPVLDIAIYNLADTINEVMGMILPKAPAERVMGGGIDTVPAMLTPGEFVVNKEATKQFYTQLVNMNKVKGYNDGGMVTTNIGDINIHQMSSGNEQVDVIHLGKLLQREIRRGTVNLG